MSVAQSEYPGSNEKRRIVLRTIAHLSRDETAPKMGHPIVVVQSGMGHPAEDGAPGKFETDRVP